MLTRRIISCLDIKNGRVVKGTYFKDLRDSGDPLKLAKRYEQEGADELVLLDIAATVEERKNRTELVRAIAGTIAIPFSVGGGINKLEHISELLSAGADKISIGSAAVTDPGFVQNACDKFGSQAIIVSIDPKRSVQHTFKGSLGSRRRFTGELKAQPVALADHLKPSDPLTREWTVYIEGGRKDSELDAIEFAKKMEGLGVGELLMNSLDRDGTKLGFDVELLAVISETVNIPVIASSGAGSIEDFIEVFKKTGVTAALGASVFHNSEFSIGDVKRRLYKEDIEVRL